MNAATHSDHCRALKLNTRERGIVNVMRSVVMWDLFEDVVRGLYHEDWLTYPGYLSVTWVDLPRYSQSRISGTTKLVINLVIEPRVFQSGSLRAHIKGRCLQCLTNHKHGETLQSSLLYHGGADKYSSTIWRIQTHHPVQKQHCCCSKSQEAMLAENCRLC